MAIETNREKLERVQALIREIESSPNASTSAHDRAFTKHRLEALYDRERELLALVAREERGGITMQQIVSL